MTAVYRYMSGGQYVRVSGRGGGSHGARNCQRPGEVPWQSTLLQCYFSYDFLVIVIVIVIHFLSF